MGLYYEVGVSLVLGVISRNGAYLALRGTTFGVSLILGVYGEDLACFTPILKKT